MVGAVLAIFLLLWVLFILVVTESMKGPPVGPASLGAILTELAKDEPTQILRKWIKLEELRRYGQKKKEEA